MTWTFVPVEVVRAIHAEQIAEHGGADGVLSENALLGALDRPENLAAYGEPDVADLAASYLVGIAKNHPFGDGNKRTAWVVAALFVDLNGYALTFSSHDAEAMVLDVAASKLDDAGAADWFRARMRLSTSS